MVVACVFMVVACTWGLNSAYGIYLAYYLSHDLNPSATPYHYALIGGLSVSTSMTLGPVVAFLYRRGFTTQHIMLLGTALQLSSLPKASWALTSLPGLFLTQGVLFGLSIGFLFIPFNDHLQTVLGKTLCHQRHRHCWLRCRWKSRPSTSHGHSASAPSSSRSATSSLPRSSAIEINTSIPPTGRSILASSSVYQTSLLSCYGGSSPPSILCHSLLHGRLFLLHRA